MNILAKIKDKWMGMKPMNISQAGIDLIKKFEGYRENAYYDSVDIPTIGYGTIMCNGRKVQMGDTCTKEEAEYWLKDHLEKHVVPWINMNVKVKLTQNMFDSLCSFIYNLGATNFLRSTLLKQINLGLFESAAEQFLRWDKAGGKVVAGLTKRRKEERELFLKDINTIKHIV